MEINRIINIELSIQDIEKILEYSINKDGIGITKGWFGENYHIMKGPKNPIIEEIEKDWRIDLTVDKVYEIGDLDWLDYTEGAGEIRLDGRYTADQLEALVIAIREETKND